MIDEAKEKRRQYLIKNRDRIKAHAKEYSQRPEVKERKRRYLQEHYIKNKETILTKKRKHRQRPEVKKKIREYAKQYYARERDKIFEAYGNKCACCGETIRQFLTIDHINRDGETHRQQVGVGLGVYLDIIKQGFPKDKYRILCMNCNFAIRDDNPCPHKVERMQAKIIQIS